MKKAIKLVVLVMASAMMMSGCGKEEKISSKDLAVQEDYGNVEQGIVQGGTEAQEDLQEVAINSYEELEAYETDRMNGIVSAFADSGLSYELTENQMFAYNLETNYWVLENEYRTYCLGYSMYDSSIGAADTVMSVSYEFHPEKGLSGDNEIVKLLYSFIQAADNTELKEKYKSCEELAAGLVEAAASGTTSTVFDSANSKLVVEVESASKYILKYAELDRIFCNIEQPEQSYKEFDSYADYQDYIDVKGLRESLEKYIVEKDNKVINTSEQPGAVTAESDPETLLAQGGGVQTYMGERMTVGTLSTRNQDNSENNFEIAVHLNMQFDNDHKNMAREYLQVMLEYLQNENLLPNNGDIEDWEKEIMSYSQMDKLRGYFGIAVKDWFGIDMWSYSKYPYLKESHIILAPTKVEGLLNG